MHDLEMIIATDCIAALSSHRNTTATEHLRDVMGAQTLSGSALEGRLSQALSRPQT